MNRQVYSQPETGRKKKKKKKKKIQQNRIGLLSACQRKKKQLFPSKTTSAGGHLALSVGSFLAVIGMLSRDV
jgi:predicted secreted Zn-dependent protease